MQPNNLLLDYAILTLIFGLWILLDSWAIVWREGFWKPPGKYDAGLSAAYVRCLRVVFGILSAALVAMTGRLELILAIIILQQAGTEDFGYWIVGTLFFGKDWSFAPTGKVLGIVYPKAWPWLNGMPVLKFFSGGAVTFGGLLTSVVVCNALIFILLSLTSLINWGGFL
jgi:hypothetical protein